MSRLLIISLCSVVFLAACTPQPTDETTDAPEMDAVEVEQESTEETESEMTEEESMEEESSEEEAMEETEMMEEEPAEETEEPQAESQAAQYVTYSDGAIAEYAGSDKVIFFHASWCPSCRALDAELSEKVSQLPEGTVVMKADYDQETELRQKYGVNLQHTLVFVDDEGNATRSNLTGADFAKLQAEL